MNHVLKAFQKLFGNKETALYTYHFQWYWSFYFYFLTTMQEKVNFEEYHDFHIGYTISYKYSVYLSLSEEYINITISILCLGNIPPHQNKDHIILERHLLLL